MHPALPADSFNLGVNGGARKPDKVKRRHRLKVGRSLYLLYMRMYGIYYIWPEPRRAKTVKVLFFFFFFSALLLDMVWIVRHDVNLLASSDEISGVAFAAATPMICGATRSRRRYICQHACLVYCQQVPVRSTSQRLNHEAGSEINEAGAFAVELRAMSTPM